MNEQQMRPIRSAYSFLREQRTFLREEVDRNRTIMDVEVFEHIRRELAEVEAVNPGLLPVLDPREAEYIANVQGMPRQHGYRAKVVITYLNRAIPRLEAELSTETTAPVIQQRDFVFVDSEEIRLVVERDYRELQRAFVAACWKSVLILCGGAIEALLVDVLQQNRRAATGAHAAPKRHRDDPNRWSLSDLIAVAIELGKISEGAEKLSHSVREYRNLVHPGNEVRSKLSVGQEEASIAIEVLHLVHRDLSA